MTNLATNQIQIAETATTAGFVAFATNITKAKPKPLIAIIKSFAPNYQEALPLHFPEAVSTLQAT